MKIFMSSDKTFKSPFFYIIRHKPSGKLYAGVKYAKNHCNSQTFMTEYGYQTTSKVVKRIIEEETLSSFEIDRIRHFNSAEEAIVYEERFLNKVNAMQHEKFLNKCNGGRTFRCVSLSEETKSKLKGQRRSDETKKKMKEGCKRRPPLSEEVKDKLRELRTGKKMSSETKQKISEASKNRKPISEETRQKMRDSCKNRKPMSDQTKEKIRNTNTGKTASIETKQKMRESHVRFRWWNNGHSTKFSEECPGEGWVLGRSCSKVVLNLLE